jgi:hypothetical protein
MSSVDYEFVFASGVFTQTEYDACPVADVVGDRQQVIEGTVAQIQNLFNNTVLNLHKFSTYVEHGTKNYKVTVTNPDY